MRPASGTLKFQVQYILILCPKSRYAGEKYENVAFRVTMRGELQTEIPMPDYIKKQVLEAYKLYEAQNMDDFKEE